MTPASPQKHRASMGVRQEILNLALLVNLEAQAPIPGARKMKLDLQNKLQICTEQTYLIKRK